MRIDWRSSRRTLRHWGGGINCLWRSSWCRAGGGLHADGLPADAGRAAMRQHEGMDKTIDMESVVDRAGWCGHFCCTEDELVQAVLVMDSSVVGLVALYLASRSAEGPPAKPSRPH